MRVLAPPGEAKTVPVGLGRLGFLLCELLLGVAVVAVACLANFWAPPPMDKASSLIVWGTVRAVEFGFCYYRLENIEVPSPLRYCLLSLLPVIGWFVILFCFITPTGQRGWKPRHLWVTTGVVALAVASILVCLWVQQK